MAAEVKQEAKAELDPLSSTVINTEQIIKQETRSASDSEPEGSAAAAEPAPDLPDLPDPAVAASSAAPAPEAGRAGRKVSTADIQLVQNLIEKCLTAYLSQREVVSTLHQQAKIEPGFTQLVWQKLEEQNPDFFRAYFTRLKLKDQINLFNHLLEQQVNVVQRMQRGWMQPPGMMMPSRPGLPAQSNSMQAGMSMQSPFPQQVKAEQDSLAGAQPLGSTPDFSMSAQPGVEDNLNLLPDFGLDIASPVNDGNLHNLQTDFTGAFSFPSPGHNQAHGDEHWGTGAFPRNLSLSDLSLDQLGTDVDHNAMALWTTEGHHELPAMPKNMSFSELPQLDYELDK